MSKYMKSGEVRKGESLHYDGKGFYTKPAHKKRPLLTLFWCLIALLAVICGYIIVYQPRLIIDMLDWAGL